MSKKLTLALASTRAPLRRRMRMISVWLARAARWRGVSPLTVGTSGLASCCSKYMTIFIQPMKLATCRGVRPDWKRHGIIFNMEQIWKEGSTIWRLVIMNAVTWIACNILVRYLWFNQLLHTVWQAPFSTTYGPEPRVPFGMNVVKSTSLCNIMKICLAQILPGKLVST